MHLDEIYVTLYITHTISTRYHDMNDYDAAYVWDYETSCHDDNLDETYTYTHVQDTWELDDEYARDSCDYAQLAYTHFA